MKKNIFAATAISALLTLSVTGCSRSDKWEYKVVPINSEGHDRTGSEAGKFSSITPSDEMLNKLGADGWELSTSYLEMETAWFNFGKDEYVTGLQPNIRPQRVVFVFKRRL